MTTLSLPSYDIHIGNAGFFSQWLEGKSYSKVLVLVDAHTKQHCLPLWAEKTGRQETELICIPPGEAHKNIRTCEEIWRQLLDAGADRHSLLLNLGGGVIGDMGGFCAATFMRGIDFVQVPSTLLSQVDASIGGKLAIDFGRVKNSIGLFRDPAAVFIDPDFLHTLPEQERISGFAEIIKHSLIADRGAWADLQRFYQTASPDWAAYILPSLRIKQRIVMEDPFEKGIRKALNFGHTIGHAVESFALESDHPLTHGEAVAIGMICESWLSTRICGLPESELAEIAAFLRRHYAHYPLDTNIFPELIRLMGKDKKNEQSRINFSLLPAIGQALINQTASEGLIRESLEFYNAVFGG